MPFTVGDLNEWLAPQPATGATFSTAGPMPLLGIDVTMDAAADAAVGLGLPTCVLTPTAAVTTLLRLYPTGRFMLNDALGPALALITWRTAYERSDYHLPWPRITGCALVLRADLLAPLTRRAPAPLAIREYLIGDRFLAGDH